MDTLLGITIIVVIAILAVVFFHYEKQYNEVKGKLDKTTSTRGMANQLAMCETYAMLTTFNWDRWQKCFVAWIQIKGEWIALHYSLEKGNVWAYHPGMPEKLTGAQAFYLLIHSNIGMDEDHQTHPEAQL